MKFKEIVSGYEQKMLEDIRALVAIRSVQGQAKEGMPFGEGPARALQAALNIGKRMGFQTENLENYAGYIEMGAGKDLIGILCHMDIVPEGENWAHDPYAVEILNGKIYGRGVCDNKGPAIMILYAMKILRDSGVPLNKRVRFVLGANEESGFGCMEHYKKVEEPFTMGFSPDAEFPLIFGEKGTFRGVLRAPLGGNDRLRIVELSGGQATNAVCSRCDCTLQGDADSLDNVKNAFEVYLSNQGRKGNATISNNILVLVLWGINAHASLPHLGVNAISYLVDFLRTVIKDSPFVNGYAATIGLEYDGTLCTAACNDEYGELTLNIGIISTQKSTAIATMDIRYPITVDFAQYIPKMQAAFESAGLALKACSYGKSLLVRPDSDLVQELYSAYTEVTGDRVNRPITIGGATYAKAFENVVAFGPAFPGEQNGVHMANEYMTLESILVGTEIYINAIQRLLAL